MTIRAILLTLIFAFKALLSMAFFILKIKTSLFLTKRSWIRKMKKVLKMRGLPSDLRAELLKIYRAGLNEATSKLTSMLKFTSLLRGLSPMSIERHEPAGLRHRYSHEEEHPHDTL